jgi:hypothetical protein
LESLHGRWVLLLRSLTDAEFERTDSDRPASSCIVHSS